MNTSAIFKEYIWLVHTIHTAGRISLKELSKKWSETEMGGGFPLARTTFNRHMNAVEDIFGIYILCDRKNQFKYYIGNDHVLNDDSVQNWMLSTLMVNNTISECQSIHDSILLENIPAEGDNLNVIIKSLKKSCVLKITYKKYSSSQEKLYTVEPYCIKLFHRRWYLLCKKQENGEFRTLSFDRMQDIEITKETFERDSDFDAENYFNDYFGIVNGCDSAKEKVVIRAFGTERYSMRDLPIHISQKEIETTDEYSDFELHLHTTLDLAGYLVSRAHLIKVLEPASLVEKVCDLHRQALNLYTKE